MKIQNMFVAIFACSVVTVNAQSSLADNVALFWNLYDSVVRGSRILHDVTEGAGAVSKAIKAIDLFLDISNEEELVKSIKSAENADAIADTDTTIDDPTAQKSTKSKKKTSSVAGSTAKEQTCDASKDGACPVSPTTTDQKTPTESAQAPKFNGCGALGFHIKDSNLPVENMMDCCGVHDTCYSANCKANKRDCDYKLRSCLFQVCDGKTLERSLLKSCKAAAKLLFSGTMALSFQQYNDAQNPLKCSRKQRRGGRRRK